MDPSADQRGAGPVPWQVRAASEWAWRFLVIAGAVAVVLYLAALFRLVVFPVIVALLVAALLHPLVARLRRWGLPRGLAVPAVFLGGLALLVGTVVLVVNLLVDGLGDIEQQVRGAGEKIRNWLTDGPLNLSDRQLDDAVDSVRRAVENNREQITAGALGTATVAVEIVTGALLSLFVTFFFLYDGERIWNWVVLLFPRRSRAHAMESGRRAWRTLVGYVRGTLLVALFDGVFTGVLLAVLGVPLAVPLGLLVFLGAFVPLVGATVTGAVAVLVALVTQGLAAALVVLGGVIAIQQVEGHVLQPFVVGRLVRVHPVAVVLSVAAGAVIAGITGAVIAVPLVAVLNSVGRYLAELTELALVPAASPEDPKSDPTSDPGSGSAPGGSPEAGPGRPGTPPREPPAG